MHDKSLSFLKRITLVTSTLVLSVVLVTYHFYAEARNKFGSPRKCLLQAMNTTPVLAELDVQEMHLLGTKLRCSVPRDGALRRDTFGRL